MLVILGLGISVCAAGIFMRSEQEDLMQYENHQTITEEKIAREKKKVENTRKEDTSAKIIFDDPILCSQFLRGYVPIPLLKSVQPEDIEDVTERFVHMFTEERNSDVIKRVHLKGINEPFYLISLIEHKSKVDYNVVMQILRYMVFIWEDYEKEQERLQKGISKAKDFKYPPVLPIIYYTGSGNWTAAVQLSDRVYLSDILSEYIPDFRCIMVQIKDYTNLQLMEKHDELSILMMINKMKRLTDFTRWKEEVDLTYMEDTTEKTPEYLLGIMAHMIELLLENINVPREEAETVAGKVKERDMAGLFDHFEKVDIQAIRARIREEERAEAEKAKEEARAEAEKIRAETAKVVIETCQELGVSKEDTLVRLVEKMELTREKAVECLTEYWNEN